MRLTLDLRAVPRPRARTLTVAAIVVTLVAVVAGGSWLWWEWQQQRGLEPYTDAIVRLGGAGVTPEQRAQAARDLERALHEHPASPLAPLAALSVGNQRYEARQWEAARAAYQVAVARSTGGTLRTLAAAGFAYSWEAERNFAKAIEAYRAALAGLRPGDFLYAQLLIDLARAQELAGRKAEAVETYRRVLRDAGTTYRADEVRSRLASLGAVP